LIGLIGTFGAVYLSHLLEESREQKKEEAVKKTSEKETIVPK